MSSTRRYTVRSRFARTGLTCTETVAEQIRRLSTPFLSVDAGEHGQDWQVIAGSHAPARAVTESVMVQGEVPVEYAVDHATKSLFHISPLSESWVAQSLLRATRAIHRSAASREGALLVHAGLIRLNGIGIALVGGSRAGKTSLIMAAVRDKAGVMVCNDDLALVAGSDAADVIGVGWPRSISVRLDALDLLFGPDRSAGIQAALSHPGNQTLASLRESGIEPHGTALVYPWEYAKLLDTDIAQDTRVNALVHLSLANDPSEGDLRVVGQSVGTELMEERILKAPNKHLNIFGHEPRAGTADTTRDAVMGLPPFRFRYVFRDVRREAERLVDFVSRRL